MGQPGKLKGLTKEQFLEFSRESTIEEIASSFGATREAFYQKRRKWGLVMPQGSYELDPSRVPDLTIEEKVWLACAIDGEGYLTLWRDPRRRSHSYTLRIGVVNTDKRFADHAKELMGKTAQVYTRISRAPNGRVTGKMTYDVTITNRVAVLLLLRQIQPYLIIKVDKAKQILKWIAANSILVLQNNVGNV